MIRKLALSVHNTFPPYSIRFWKWKKWYVVFGRVWPTVTYTAIFSGHNHIPNPEIIISKQNSMGHYINTVLIRRFKQNSYYHEYSYVVALVLPYTYCTANKRKTNFWFVHNKPFLDSAAELLYKCGRMQFLYLYIPWRFLTFSWPRAECTLYTPPSPLPQA